MDKMHSDKPEILQILVNHAILNHYKLASIVIDTEEDLDHFCYSFIAKDLERYPRRGLLWRFSFSGTRVKGFG